MAETFPVDDATLDLLEEALHGGFRSDDQGEPVWHGSEFSVSQLLEVMSGYDAALAVPDDQDLAPTHLDVPVPVRTGHYPGRLFGEWDVLLALIAEVRRLRPRSDL